MTQQRLEACGVALASSPLAQREEELQSLRQQQAVRLGLPWPRHASVKRPGRPTREQQWQDLLYRSLFKNELPAIEKLQFATCPRFALG
eukprot:5014752-Amphidinium_carterae.2